MRQSNSFLVFKIALHIIVCFLIIRFSPAFGLTRRDTMTLKTGYVSMAMAGYLEAKRTSTSNLTYEWEHFFSLKDSLVNSYELIYVPSLSRTVYQGIGAKYRRFFLSNGISYDENVEGSSLSYSSAVSLFAEIGMGLGRYLIEVFNDRGALEAGSESFAIVSGAGVRTSLGSRVHFDAAVNYSYSKGYGAFLLRTIDLKLLVGLGFLF